MYELDRHSSFTDRRGDSLHGPGAHISRGEDTRTAGFQQEWRPREAPRSRLCEGRSRPDETFCVTLNVRRQPTGSGCRPNETKYRRSLYGSLLPSLVICDLDRR